MLRARGVPFLMAAGVLLAAGNWSSASRAAKSHSCSYESGVVTVAAEEKKAEEKGKPAEKTEDAEDGLRAATEVERKGAIASIETQLKAFKANDYVKATKYQHSSLRDNFRTPEEFRKMMRESYPQFANYKSVTFGEARCDAKGEAMQIQATVTGQDGVVVRAIYVMVKEEGEYRVGSVLGGIPSRVVPREVV